jgi:hypothetical protein
MALGDDYVTLSELKSYMGNELPLTDDAELTSAIDSASREIERFTHRQFNKADEASARKYVALDAHNVFVDDFYTTDDFVLETEDPADHHSYITWEDHDYELQPLDGLMNGMPWVYWHIIAVGDKTFPRKGPKSMVRATAIWGWENVPAPVHQAALELSASTYGLRNARLGVAGSDQFGTVIRVGDNRMAYNKLARFRRISTQCL